MRKIAEIKIYSDGASSRNGMPDAKGGWGFVVLIDDKLKSYGSGGQDGATNQQMELKGVIEGLKDSLGFSSIKEDNYTVYTDSAYIVNCLRDEWWVKWISNGWRNAKNEPVANKELWIELLDLKKETSFNLIKVKGHSGNKYNEMADNLAVSARSRV